MKAPPSERSSRNWVLIAVLMVAIAVALLAAYSGGGGRGGAPGY